MNSIADWHTSTLIQNKRSKQTHTLSKKMKNPSIASQNAGAPVVQPEKIDSIENEDGITIGETYLVRRADSSVCQAQVIQARMSEFGYYEYYVHYVGLNRRLDQWVQRSQLLSSPSPESLESPQTIRVSTDGPSMDQMTDDSSDRKITRNQKRRHDEINHVQKTYAEMDPTTGKLTAFISSAIIADIVYEWSDYRV